MSIYEYKMMRGYISLDKLNEFGKEGWEMCGFTLYGEDYVYYFKRLKQLENEFKNL